MHLKVALDFQKFITVQWQVPFVICNKLGIAGFVLSYNHDWYMLYNDKYISNLQRKFRTWKAVIEIKQALTIQIGNTVRLITTTLVMFLTRLQVPWIFTLLLINMIFGMEKHKAEENLIKRTTSWATPKSGICKDLESAVQRVYLFRLGQCQYGMGIHVRTMYIRLH